MYKAGSVVCKAAVRLHRSSSEAGLLLWVVLLEKCSVDLSNLLQSCTAAEVSLTDDLENFQRLLIAVMRQDTCRQ